MKNLQKKMSEKPDWKTYVIFLLLSILFATFFITKNTTRKQTINEIYADIDARFNDCAKSCGLLEPIWTSIRKGIFECYCLDNGNQTNNQISTGDN